MAILKHYNIRTSITAILLIATLTITVTTSIQPVFAPRECPGCIGNFQKLTGEFVQNVINNQRSPNSENVAQFRILTAQFERDIINALLNDHLNLIPGIVEQFVIALGQPLPTLPPETQQDIDEYTHEVLRIFCKPCI
jgi:hypothetical protein